MRFIALLFISIGIYICVITIMDVKLVMLILTGIFIISCLFFGTKNGFYDTDNYDGNGTAH